MSYYYSSYQEPYYYKTSRRLQNGYKPTQQDIENGLNYIKDRWENRPKPDNKDSGGNDSSSGGGGSSSSGGSSSYSGSSSSGGGGSSYSGSSSGGSSYSGGGSSSRTNSNGASRYSERWGQDTDGSGNSYSSYTYAKMSYEDLYGTTDDGAAEEGDSYRLSSLQASEVDEGFTSSATGASFLNIIYILIGMLIVGLSCFVIVKVYRSMAYKQKKSDDELDESQVDENGNPLPRTSVNNFLAADGGHQQVANISIAQDGRLSQLEDFNVANDVSQQRLQNCVIAPNLAESQNQSAMVNAVISQVFIRNSNSVQPVPQINVVPPANANQQQSQNSNLRSQQRQIRRNNSTQQVNGSVSARAKKNKLSVREQKIFDSLLRDHTAQGQYQKEFAEFGESSCVVCMEDFKPTANSKKERKVNSIRKVFACGHIFHSHCFEDWLIRKISDPRCPLCNQYITGEPPKEDDLDESYY